MNPNLFVGKLYDGQRISSNQRHQDGVMRSIVQNNIWRQDIEDFKKEVNHKYKKPNEPLTLVKPVHKVFITKNDFVSGEMKHAVLDIVNEKVKPTKEELLILPRLKYMEQEIDRLQHDIIQLRKQLNSM